MAENVAEWAADAYYISSDDEANDFTITEVTFYENKIGDDVESRSNWLRLRLKFSILYQTVKLFQEILPGQISQVPVDGVETTKTEL
jgi:hypothetical protein